MDCLEPSGNSWKPLCRRFYDLVSKHWQTHRILWYRCAPQRTLTECIGLDQLAYGTIECLEFAYWLSPTSIIAEQLLGAFRLDPSCSMILLISCLELPRIPPTNMSQNIHGGLCQIRQEGAIGVENYSALTFDVEYRSLESLERPRDHQGQMPMLDVSTSEVVPTIQLLRLTHEVYWNQRRCVRYSMLYSTREGLQHGCSYQWSHDRASALFLYQIF